MASLFSNGITVDPAEDESMEWLMASSASVEKVVDNNIHVEQTKHLETFLDVLRSEFLDEPKLEENFAVGTLASMEQFQSLLRQLKAVGFFFAIRTSRCLSGRGVLTKPPKSISVDQPFVLRKCTKFYCSAGNATQVRGALNESKRKNNCGAQLVLREVCLLAGVKLPIKKSRKTECLRNLRQEIAKNGAKGRIAFWVSVALPKTHNHPISCAGKHIDSEVKASMYRLLQNGLSTTNDIQKRLHKIVDEEFSQAPVRPSLNNSSFYPNKKVIYNHLRHEGLTRNSYTKRKRKNESTLENVKVMMSNNLNNLQEAVQRSTCVKTIAMANKMVLEIENLFNNT